MAKIRINRALAQAGVASRRAAEGLVLTGRVKLNGQTVSELATSIDPQRDKLEVDGKRVKLMQNVYFIYYKPRGMITSMTDPDGRPCLGDVCGELPGSPRPVGRLDRASEGLLLLTNDGQVALRMTHPRYGVRKEYKVTVSPALTDAHARQMCSGVELADGTAHFEGMTLNEQSADRSMLTVTVSEGRTHFIRRMFDNFSYRVLRLKRMRMGSLQLGRLRPGEHRQLSAIEVATLMKMLGFEGKKPEGKKPEGKK